MNIQLDDISPQISYYAAGNSASGWILNHTNDTLVKSYNKGTFHGTFGDGDRMEYKFNGSAITIYGAKRDNHGIYGVSMDGGKSVMADGYSKTAMLKQVLYTKTGLDSSEHTVTVTNYPNLDTAAVAGEHWLDIDYIETTTFTSGQVYTTIIDDSSTLITYNNWNTYVDANKNVEFYNLTDHTTSTKEATVTIPFTGSSLQLIGSVNDVHGNYSVSLDGATAEVYSSNFWQPVYQIPIYTASGLDEGDHTVTVTNLGSGTTAVLSFDYAMVNSTSSPSSSSTVSSSTAAAGVSYGTEAVSSGTLSASSDLTSTVSTTNTNTASSTSASASAVIAGASASSSGTSTNVGAISGGVAGGVVALALFGVLGFWFFRRRRQQQASPSENGEEGSRTGIYRDHPGTGSGVSQRGIDLGSASGRSAGGGRYTPRSMLWSGSNPVTPITPFVDSPNLNTQPQQQYHPPPGSNGSGGWSSGAFLYNSTPGSGRMDISPFYPSIPPPPTSNASSYPLSSAPVHSPPPSLGAIPVMGGMGEMYNPGQGTVSTAQLSEKSRAATAVGPPAAPGSAGSGGDGSRGSFSAYSNLSHVTAGIPASISTDGQVGGQGHMPPNYVQVTGPPPGQR
ncbi:hypothetical protein IAR50_002605 [Cryptococcus sp. DSM 104548]